MIREGISFVKGIGCYKQHCGGNDIEEKNLCSILNFKIY